jgi:hypothetical protein
LQELILLRRTARRAKARNVASHLGFLLQVLQRLVQNARGRLVFGRDESIVHPFAFTSRHSDAGAPEIGKMARDLRLTDAQDLDEIADANLAVGDQIQQAQPRRVGQRAEQQVEGGVVLCLAHKRQYNTSALTYMTWQHTLGRIRICVYDKRRPR